MKKWMQKLIVITVALVTFGIISPNHEIWELLEHDHSSSSNNNGDYQSSANSVTYEDSISDEVTEHSTYLEEQSINSILLTAKEQSYMKFGSKISPVIGKEFDARILPKIEEVIQVTLARHDEEKIPYIKISDQPSGNYSEKIFHISNGYTGQDLLRFHVRTERRPVEGYYYNFHYHTVEDQYVKHHNIGDIYYSKNTPPKWLS
ncbi:hypothetical protein MTP04_16610 [Lysinibacillus sp. PLM2]|nr:hypothetical protein MTP04_16610 [Lysinibacillus sp. PLM2]